MRSRQTKRIAIALTLSIFGSIHAQLKSSLGQVPANVDEKSNTQDDPMNSFRPGSELAEKIKLPEGFHASVFAHEPDVNQPIGLATDHRGRLWVAENYTYAEASVNFDTKFKDRIVVLQDKDNDGKFDERKVFWDQGERLTSVEVGFGGVWALCAPNLYFIPDRNGDDVPDGPAEIVLDGWDYGPVRHNIVNGLRWGPDGWLYGRHGILATSYVGAPGTAATDRTPINCGVWRYHPTQKKFEVVAQGTTNPWGMDWNEHGELFMINTVIGHLWHVVPGSYFQRMYGAHFNPYLYEFQQQTADHFHWNTEEEWHFIRKEFSSATDQAGGGHAHSGLLIYQEENWPAEYRNDVFAINLHGRRLNRDKLIREGGAFVGKHAPDFMKVDDIWFRGIELVSGPDGEVWIADWSDIGECHENDGVHRTSGRILEVSYGARKPLGTLDLSKKQDVELAAMLVSGVEWYSRQARRILQERAVSGKIDSSAIAKLMESFNKSESAREVLRAAWGLNSIGKLTEQEILSMIRSPHENVRVWGIRFAAEGDKVNKGALAELIKSTPTEQSGLVLTYTCSLLQELPVTDRTDLIQAIAKSKVALGDHNLESLFWYGIEPWVLQDAKNAVNLVEGTNRPRIAKLISRRLAEDDVHLDQNLQLLFDVIASPESEPNRKSALLGVSLGLQSVQQVKPPNSWESLLKIASQADDAEVKAVLGELAAVFGDGQGVEKLIAMVKDGKVELAIRQKAMRTLARGKYEAAVPVLHDFILDRDLGAEAIKGLAANQNKETALTLITNFSRMSRDKQEFAVNTLCARAVTAEALVVAISEGKVPRTALGSYQLRQLGELKSKLIEEKLTDLGLSFNDVFDKEELKLRVTKLVKAPEMASADVSEGRLLFNKTCSSCHKLFGLGGNVGPDLTGAQRHELGYLLENMIDPSAQVGENYRTTVVATTDGRVLSAIVVREDDRALTLRTPTEEIVVIKDEIEERRPTPLSIMPNGLLLEMSDTQIQQLFKYLQSQEQVPLPADSQPAPK